MLLKVKFPGLLASSGPVKEEVSRRHEPILRTLYSGTKRWLESVLQRRKSMVNRVGRYERVGNDAQVQQNVCEA